MSFLSFEIYCQFPAKNFSSWSKLFSLCIHSDELFNFTGDVYSCFKTLAGLKFHDQKNTCNAVTLESLISVPPRLFFFKKISNPLEIFLMVKSGKSFVKIRSRFQVSIFSLFYRNFQHPPTPAYLILPNFPTPPPFFPLRLLGPSPPLFGTQEYGIVFKRTQLLKLTF